LTGVGLGSYTDVAQTVNPQAARVHNVLLLVTAELGLPGLLPLLWLLLAPLTFKPLRPAALAPWIAMLIIGLFDGTLWLTSNWQTAVLFGLLTANLWTESYPDSHHSTKNRIPPTEQASL
jgi:O-antigen ligase